MHNTMCSPPASTPACLSAGVGPSFQDEDESEEHSDSDDEGLYQAGAGARRGRPGQHGEQRPAKRARRSTAEDAAGLAQRRSLIMDYYSNKSGYGKPSSLLVFNLAHALQYENSFHLW